MVIKKRFYLLFSLVIILASIMTVYAVSDQSHAADSILITINGYTMTLQQAIDGNYLVNELPLPDPSAPKTTFLNPSHTADEIIISVNGQTETLQDAVRGVTLQNKGLCSSSSPNPTNEPSLGHISTEIEVATTNLQTKINNGDFCDPYTYRWVATSWGGCSTTCGTGDHTRTYTCKRYNGNTLVDNAPSDSYCSSETAYQNTIREGGTCNSGTNTCTSSCEVGSSTCGWGNWVQGTDCNAVYGGQQNCGTGNLQRTRTCIFGVGTGNYLNHCAGSNTDYGGASCTESSGCSYKYITLQSRTIDYTSQCTSYWWKHWWWQKAGNDYWNPCTHLLGTGWEVYSATPVIYNNLAWCNVQCRKKVPDAQTSILTGSAHHEGYSQCLDYGYKSWWGMGSCPSGYSKVQYQLTNQYITQPIRCQTLCVKESWS